MSSQTIDRAAAKTPALSITDIADLSDSVLSDLTREELVQLIDAAAAQVPLSALPEAPRLDLRDTQTLHRLACLARFACRNRIRYQVPRASSAQSDHGRFEKEKHAGSLPKSRRSNPDRHGG